MIHEYEAMSMLELENLSLEIDLKAARQINEVQFEQLKAQEAELGDLHALVDVLRGIQAKANAEIAQLKAANQRLASGRGGWGDRS
jgi:hypothetical protein